MRELISIDNFSANVEDYPIKTGDIILYRSKIKKGYTWLQNEVQDTWDTEYELNHTSIGFPPIHFPVMGLEIPVVYEAKASMSITEWADVVNSRYTDFEVWGWLNDGLGDFLVERALERAVHDVYHQTDSEGYAYAQILYFGLEALATQTEVGKALWKILGSGDIQKMQNWFPDGQICSEIVYRVQVRVSQLLGWYPLRLKTEEWNENNISPVGIKKILKAFEGKYFYKKHHRIIR